MSKQPRPMFSTRHYEAIANTVRRLDMGIQWLPSAGWVPLVKWASLVNMLIDMFEGDNPSFDRDKFIKAVEKG